MNLFVLDGLTVFQIKETTKVIIIFFKRSPKSYWSNGNKLKVEKLLEQNLMKPAGLAMIEITKSNVTWDILDDV